MKRLSIHKYWLLLVILLTSLCPFECLHAQESVASPKKASTNVLRGDVDHDNRRTVTDCMIVVSYILDENSVELDFDVADLDHNGLITVTDVMIIVSIILGEPYQDENNPVFTVDDEPSGGNPQDGI